MKLRALVVDDESVARDWLRALLVPEPDLEIVSECDNGAAAVDLVRRFSPNVVFMDIQMPGMGGLEAIDRIQPLAQPAVVFVTGDDQHAVHAFETCALDYLVKPIAPERVKKTIERVRNHLRNSAPANLNPNTERFCVRTGQRTTFVEPAQIDWIEADGNYAILHTGPRKFLLRETMSHLESQLPAMGFLRVGRSAILNLSRVTGVQTAPGGHHFALLGDGRRIPVTRSIQQVKALLRRP